MKWLSTIVPRMIAVMRSQYNGNIEVKEIGGTRTLLVNAVQQTGPYPNRLWELGLREILRKKQKPRRILVFGVGGGYVFQLLSGAFPRAEMTGVDIDPAIIRISRGYFGLDGISRLNLVCEDAGMYVRKQKRTKYDLVIIDVYIGNDVPAFVTTDVFLTGVYRLLGSGGELVINYFHATKQKSGTKQLADVLLNRFRRVRYHPVLRNIFFYVVK